MKEIIEKLDEINKKLDKHDKEIKQIKEKVSTELMAAKGRLVKCHKCQYEWVTKSSMKQTSCPSCRAIIKIEECLVENE